MTVAVVVVSHNSGPILGECLGLLLESTLVSQIVWVDNASAPDEAGLCAADALALTAPRITALKNAHNLGYATAVNLGAQQCRAAWLLLLNPDCLLPPTTLQLLLEQARALPALGVLGCQLVDRAGHPEPASCRRDLSFLRLLVDTLRLHRLGMPGFVHRPAPNALSSVAQVSGALMLMPASSFAAVKGMDAGYFLHFEDMDLCLRLRRSGLPVYFSPLRVTHVKGTSSMRDPGAVLAHKQRSLRRYLKRHRLPMAPLIVGLSHIAWHWRQTRGIER